MRKVLPKRASGDTILTINGGSSTIRFALYPPCTPLRRGLHGKLERIGLAGTILQFREANGDRLHTVSAPDDGAESGVNFLVDWLLTRPECDVLAAVGHRFVHGMTRTEPALVTPSLLAELWRLSPGDPEHLPRELALVEAFQMRCPGLRQIVCFDTAFHQDMPRVARQLPLPRRYTEKGLRRYGFHGLSYAFLMEALARAGDPAAIAGRVILMHLGSGASLAAVRDGRALDTSMGFTPAGGLLMSTRSGDLDPGIADYLARTEQMTNAQFHHLVNHESGLLGVSETSSDMQDLLASEATDPRAAEAIALFCYQARKWIGAFVAVLGGLDVLVFAGGIGENASQIRAKICEGFDFLGITILPARNVVHASLISPDTGTVRVRVMHTDEEIMIAKAVSRIIKPRSS